MGHCVKQMRTSPPTQFHVWEETRCGRLQRFLKVGGYKIAKKTDQTPQKASNAKFYDGEFNDFPGFTSAQLPVTIKQHMSRRLSAASAKNTNRRRISTASSFMAMRYALEVTDKPRKTDSRILQAQEVCYSAACFQSSYWIYWMFVRPGSEKPWSCDSGSRTSELQLRQKASHSLQTHVWTPNRLLPNHRAGSRQTGTAKREQALQRKHGDCQHDLQAARVGEPPQYPHRRHGTDGSTGKQHHTGKLTPRDFESCTVSEATDPIERGAHVHPRTQERPPVDPVISETEIKHGMAILKIHNEKMARKAGHQSPAEIG